MMGKMKKISVFRVTGLKILGRVGIHFFHLFFQEYSFMHFERQEISPFKMHKIIFYKIIY